MAGSAQVRTIVEPAESRFARIAFAFRNHRGLTVGEIARILALSPSMTAEWLNLMERGGLVRTGCRWNSQGGSPLRTYRASSILRKAVSTKKEEPLETLSFDVLRELCRFQVDRCCTISQDHVSCLTSSCPYLGPGNAARSSDD